MLQLLPAGCCWLLLAAAAAACCRCCRCCCCRLLAASSCLAFFLRTVYIKRAGRLRLNQHAAHLPPEVSQQEAVTSNYTISPEQQCVHTSCPYGRLLCTATLAVNGWLLVAGYWILAARCQLPTFCCRLSATSCRSLTFAVAG